MLADIILELSNIKKSFGDNEVIKGITFSVFRGEILGIIGKSGAGKSTLMNILCGIIKDYHGKVVFNKKAIRNKKKFTTLVGFSFQPYSFYEDLTLKNNLIYFGKLYGIPKSEVMRRAEQLFSLADLDFSDLGKPARHLSGGMKKRFDIVCSLLHSPEILVLDEPTAGLDPMRRKNILSIIRRVNLSGVTVLISSHIISDMEDVCDRVLLMDKGRKVLMDTPSNIKSELLEHEQITIESFPGVYDSIIDSLSGFNILHCKVESGKLIIYTPEAEVFLHFLLHLLEKEGESLENITISEPDLTQVFQTLEGKPLNLSLRDNVNKLDDFIFSLVGKHYSQDQIKKIMVSHHWPKEVVDVLVNKRTKVMSLVERR